MDIVTSSDKECNLVTHTLTWYPIHNLVLDVFFCALKAWVLDFMHANFNV